jgi:hypothetical protein
MFASLNHAYEYIEEKISPEAVNKIPLHLKFLFEEQKFGLYYLDLRDPKVLNQIKNSDIDILIELFVGFKKPTDKKILLRILGKVGDEKVINFLKDTLLYNYKGQLLTDEKEDVLLSIPAVFGTLAQQYDSAYSFIKEGSEPKFWQTRKTWTSRRGEYSIDLLTHSSIQAIGRSGRRDVLQILNSLKKKNKNYLHRFSGSIAQAAFYDYLIGNRDKLQNRINCDREIFLKWIETPDGARWSKWADDMERGPRPPEEE